MKGGRDSCLGSPFIAGLRSYWPRVGRGGGGEGRTGLKWLKLEQKRPRFEIRNDSAIPNRDVKRPKKVAGWCGSSSETFFKVTENSG